MKSNKTILVVLDGLSYHSAVDCMGYLQSLVESNLATLYKLESELPSVSRPLYETILTGTPPHEHGVVNNEIVRLSTQESVFSLAYKAGKKTAASAYHWVSELYNKAPYNAIRDRRTHNEELPIQHGCFYHEDYYPDSHVFLDAEYLRCSNNPDFLLIHPMNIDWAGHQQGIDSAKYRNTIRHTDLELAPFISTWLAEGYQILITSDHGMNCDRSHGGTMACEREVPLYVLGDGFNHCQDAQVKQTDLCGTICELLGITNHNKSCAHDLLAQGAT